MENDHIPVLELLYNSLGASETLISRLLNSIDFRLQIISGILWVLQKVDDIGNTALDRDHALGRSADRVHSMLGIEEGKSTDVAAVLEVGVEVLRSAVCQQSPLLAEPPSGNPRQVSRDSSIIGFDFLALDF